MPGSYPSKILIVDDNPLFLKMMEQEFRKQGFIVTVKISAESAIESLGTKERPDIILSDYEMPRMNGIEFRRYLMQEEQLKDIPFVFLTYSTDRELMIKGLDLRAIDYVIKDTPVKVIIAKVNNILFMIEKQRELTEIEVKRSVASLNFRSIPVEIPEIKGFDIDFWHQAYQNIPGGDFIDIIRIDNRYTFILLGDVMGKKWRAWFFTYGFLSYIRSAIRLSAAGNEFSVAAILQKINNSICFDDVLKDVLASLSLFLADSKTGTLTYTGAGDLPLLYYNAASEELIYIQSSGVLLGLFDDSNYTEQEILMQPDNMLFAFTDGMIDFADAKDIKSDYAMFARLLKPFLGRSNAFEQMKEGIFNKGLDKQVDDKSIICLYKTEYDNNK